MLMEEQFSLSKCQSWLKKQILHYIMTLELYCFTRVLIISTFNFVNLIFDHLPRTIQLDFELWTAKLLTKLGFSTTCPSSQLYRNDSDVFDSARNILLLINYGSIRGKVRLFSGMAHSTVLIQIYKVN